MVSKIFKKIFGSRNDRLIKRMSKSVAQISAKEPEFEVLSDDQLRGKTAEFRQRLEAGESLDALLPETFAAVREGGRRAMQMRPLRRADDRRHGVAPGQDRRDAHRRRARPWWRP